MAWYGERYRSFAIDPTWIANSLIANAAKEGEGSAKLWNLSSRTPDSDIAELIRLHAIDESHHARYYILLLKLSFPEAVDKLSFSALKKLSPGYSRHSYPTPSISSAMEVVWDEIVQMNIGEIRTLVHQLLLKPVLSLHCLPQHLRRLTRILDRLREDEVGHIRYTANLINRAASTMPSFIGNIMKTRMSEFNDITLTEIGL
jgi:hypothetical protein